MVSENKAYNGYVGLSTDNKPTRSVNNGSMFYEMDTQKKYMFDEEGVQWIEQPAEGGGGSTGEAFYVTIGDSGSDKTFDEVVAAFQGNQSVWCKTPNQDYYDLMTSIVWSDESASVTFGTNVAVVEDNHLYWQDGG